MSKRWTWLLVFVLMSACGAPTATPTPTRTLSLVHVQITPVLRPWVTDLYSCANQIPDTSLVLSEIAPTAMDFGKTDFSLRMGAPDPLPGFSAPIGEEEIVVVVNPANQIDQLTLDQLRGIYTGRITNWGEVVQDAPMAGEKNSSQAVQVWSALPGDDLGSSFTALLEGQSLLHRINQAPTPQAMLQAVAEYQGAIGFVTRRWLDSTVWNVRVVDGGNLLQQPVLALSATEPQGPARALVACLQKKP